MRVHQIPGAVDALLNQPLARKLVTEAAADVAEGAADVVPHHTGHAAESYQSTEAELRPEGLVATAYSDDFAAAIIEFGSVNNPPYRPLTRGVARAGLRGRLIPKGSE